MYGHTFMPGAKISEEDRRRVERELAEARARYRAYSLACHWLRKAHRDFFPLCCTSTCSLRLSMPFISRTAH